MKAKYTLLLITVLTCFSQVNAQNTFPATGSTGIGTTLPDASSILEVKSTTQGILIPRMTSNQKNAIVSPAIGLMIYQTNGASGFYYYDGSKWAAVSGKGATKSLGNLTSPTAVNVDLLPGIDNTTNIGSVANSWKDAYFDGSIYLGGSRLLSYDVINGNTIIGPTALNNNTTGSNNTATGLKALYSNTTGHENMANGNNTLYSNTTGVSNTANGYNALYFNTTGNYNTANGNFALYLNTTGATNTAIGSGALFSNTIGHDNSATGYNALSYNITGNYNTANGNYALYYNTTGSYNLANGYDALYSNTYGVNNTANGYNALYSNTSGSNNTANGYNALSTNTTGYSNVAVGSYALFLNTSGHDNTAIGDSAAFNDVNASFNTELGMWAGFGVANGSSNTYIGYYTGPTTAGLFNCTALGNTATPTASNQVRVGNDNITSIGGKVGWTTFSDGRFKKNMKENVPGLEFINQLKPITYTLDITGIKQFKGEDKKEASINQKTDNSLDEKTIHTGFVAQDVEATAKKMNYDFDGVDAAKNDKDLYGLRYSEFVVPLVKAVQELSKMNNAKDSSIADLQKQINDLKSFVLSGNHSTVTSMQSSSQTVELNGATTLAQNIPNPFSNSTTINYYLPVNNGNAYINFYGLNGAILKSIKLAGNGKGNINLKASELSSGAYRYTLFVDGKMIDSKQMVLAK